MTDYLLQEHYVQVNANWTRDVWNGAAETDAWKQWPAVKARFPVEAAKIPWEQYRHYASLVWDTPCACIGSMTCKHRRRTMYPYPDKAPAEQQTTRKLYLPSLLCAFLQETNTCHAVPYYCDRPVSV